MDPATMAALAQAAVSIGSKLFGGGETKTEKRPTMNTGQENLFKILTDFLGGQGGQGALGQLQGLLDPNSDIYKNFEKPYMNEFNEKTIPGIAEQFAGGAHGGALSSSGFGQALSGAGAGLQANLAGKKSEMMMKAISQILGLIPGTLGKEPFDYVDQETGTGFGANAMKGFGNIGSETWQDIFKGFGKEQNQQYQTKFPLTNSYDMMFRQQGLPG